VSRQRAQLSIGLRRSAPRDARNRETPWTDVQLGVPRIGADHGRRVRSRPLRPSPRSNTREVRADRRGEGRLRHSSVRPRA